MSAHPAAPALFPEPGGKTYGTLAYDPNGFVRGRPGAAGKWVITAQPDVMTRLKRVFPQMQQTRIGSLEIVDTDEVACDLEWVISRWPLEMDPLTYTRLTAAANRHQKVTQQILDVLTGTQAHTGLHLTPAQEMTPREYQRTAYDLARLSGGLLLADDLGTGKTLSSMLALSDPALRPALVVTLTGLPRQWLRELGKTFPDLTGHEVSKASPYDLSNPDGSMPDLIAMNYAKLAGWVDHLNGKVRTVIFDEVQELRRSTSRKYEAAQVISNQADLVIGASATPVYNFGGEMYSIMEALRPGLLGSRDEFARQWCESTYGLDTKTPVKDPAALRSWLTDQGAMLRRTRAEVGFELPALTVVEQSVNVDESAGAAAESSAVEIARLILGSDGTSKQKWAAKGEFDWKMRHATGVAKAKPVADFVKLILDSEERLVLTGWHRDVWAIWAEQLAEFNPVMYTGSETPAQKARAVDAFTDGTSRILMLSLRSGAGLDGLQHVPAQTVVFGELDWSPGVHKQVIGRLHRPGQDRPVAAYFCVADWGADPFMMDLLDTKRIQADLLVTPDALQGVGAGVADTVDNSEHLLRMARDVLRRHGVTLPAPGPDQPPTLPR